MTERKQKKAAGALRFIAAVLVILVIAGAVCLFLTLLDRYRTEQKKKAYPMPEAYREIVSRYSAEYKIPPWIIYAVIRTESGFRAEVESPAGAVGLMQIMPDTFTWLQKKTGETLPQESLRDPDVNIRYGCCLLRMLYDEFENWDTVFAAYNAGINRVRSWLKDPEISENGVLVNIPIAETENYVKKVRAAEVYYTELYYSATKET